MKNSRLIIFLALAFVLSGTSCQKDVTPEKEETAETAEWASRLITAPNGRKCLLKKVTGNNGEVRIQKKQLLPGHIRMSSMQTG